MTIKDIAKLADVSVSTASRVLNDRPDVSEDSRRRVRAVIEAHRYVPNNSARDLVKIRSDAVGLVVRGVQNPFYTDIIHAIEQKLDASGYTMVMRQIPSGDDEIQCGAVMEKEKRLQQTMLDIRNRFGKNALLKASSYEEGATMRQRNGQIGGHKA